MKTTYRLLALALLVSGACSFDITNPNTPPLLGANPTREQVQEAVSGLLLGARADYADWALEAGNVGREGERLHAPHPPPVDELVTRPPQPRHHPLRAGYPGRARPHKPDRHQQHE